MNDEELKPKIDTKEETLESYKDFKKRYYLYRADDIRDFIQRDGTELNELEKQSEEMYDELVKSLTPEQRKLLSNYSDNWTDIINVEIDELTRYMLADFEEER